VVELDGRLHVIDGDATGVVGDDDA